MNKPSRTSRLSSKAKEALLRGSETKPPEEPREKLLYLSTMTLSVPPTGSMPSLQALEKYNLLLEYRAHLQYHRDTKAIVTYFVTHHSNGFTISSFSNESEHFLAIFQKVVPSPQAQVKKTVLTMVKYSFLKLVTWLTNVRFLKN